MQCPCTTLKRAGGVFSHFIDAHPIPALTTCLVLLLLVVQGAVAFAARAAALLR